MDAVLSRQGLGRRMILPAAIAAVTLALLWMMQSLPIVCPAIYPAPASCAADARLAPALWGSAAVVALLAGTVIVDTLIAPAWRQRVTPLMVIALAVVAVVALALTLFASGFTLPI